MGQTRRGPGPWIPFLLGMGLKQLVPYMTRSFKESGGQCEGNEVDTFCLFKAQVDHGHLCGACQALVLQLSAGHATAPMFDRW